MSTWMVMLAAGAGTYALRVLLVLAHTRFHTPAWLARTLPLVGPVALSALLALSLFTAGGRRVLPNVVEVVAVIVAFVVVRRGASVSWGLLAGFTCYWLGTALGWTQ